MMRRPIVIDAVEPILVPILPVLVALTLSAPLIFSTLMHWVLPEARHAFCIASVPVEAEELELLLDYPG